MGVCVLSFLVFKTKKKIEATRKALTRAMGSTSAGAGKHVSENELNSMLAELALQRTVKQDRDSHMSRPKVERGDSDGGSDPEDVLREREPPSAKAAAPKAAKKRQQPPPPQQQQQQPKNPVHVKTERREAASRPSRSSSSSSRKRTKADFESDVETRSSEYPAEAATLGFAEAATLAFQGGGDSDSEMDGSDSPVRERKKRRTGGARADAYVNLIDSSSEEEDSDAPPPRATRRTSRR
jgi:hypothetical protein